jgi:prepilin peptidase CpaA
MLTQENPWLAAILILLLALVTYSDLKAHRIPNLATLGGALIAVTLNLFTQGPDGLTSSLLGLTVGFAIFLPPYLVGGMAAGDVKLMAMVGAFVGLEGALLATGLSLLAGGVIGLAFLVAKGGIGVWLRRFAMSARLFLATGNIRLSYLAPAPGEAAALRFPYAVAITAGTLIALYWAGVHGMPF